MEFVETIVCRDDFDKEFLGLLSFVFSDEYLATSFVIKQLLTWKSNHDYWLVLILEKETHLPSFVENVNSLIPRELFAKIEEQLIERDVLGSSNQDKIVCHYCKNYGSIISCRTTATSLRFICDRCQELNPVRTQPISDLLWSRRCNEYSNTQIISYSQTMKSIRKEIDQSVGKMFSIMPSMMIVKKEQHTKMLTLSMLFSNKTFRCEGYGQRLIKFIPSLGKNFSISICTAGLESEYLFSE